MASGMNRDAPPISFEAFAELKRQDRAALNALPPDEAQAAAEAILNPRLWQIADPRHLAWPGDLAGESRKGLTADASDIERLSARIRPDRC